MAQDADEVAGLFVINAVGDNDAPHDHVRLGHDGKEVGPPGVVRRAIGNEGGQRKGRGHHIVAVPLAEGQVAGDGVDGKLRGLLVLGFHADEKDLAGRGIAVDEKFRSGALGCKQFHGALQSVIRHPPNEAAHKSSRNCCNDRSRHSSTHERGWRGRKQFCGFRTGYPAAGLAQEASYDTD